MNTKTTRILYSAAFMAAIGFAGLSHAEEQQIETVTTHATVRIVTAKRDDSFLPVKVKNSDGSDAVIYMRKSPNYSKSLLFVKGKPKQENSVDTKIVAEIQNADGSKGPSMTLPWFPAQPKNSQFSIIKTNDPNKLLAQFSSGSEKPVNLELTLNYANGCYELPEKFRSTSLDEQTKGYQDSAPTIANLVLSNSEVMTAVNPVGPANIGDISNGRTDHDECLKIESDPSKGMTMSHAASTVSINIDFPSVKPVAVPNNS